MFPRIWNGVGQEETGSGQHQTPVVCGGLWKLRAPRNFGAHVIIKFSILPDGVPWQTREADCGTNTWLECGQILVLSLSFVTYPSVSIFASNTSYQFGSRETLTLLQSSCWLLNLSRGAALGGISIGEGIITQNLGMAADQEGLKSQQDFHHSWSTNKICHRRTLREYLWWLLYKG